jgi:hypothetical protein
MSHKAFRIFWVVWLALVLLLSPGTTLAQTYGQGVYGSQAYGSSSVLQQGPLPATGAAAFGLLAATAISLTIYRITKSNKHRRP